MEDTIQKAAKDQTSIEKLREMRMPQDGSVLKNLEGQGEEICAAIEYLLTFKTVHRKQL